MAEILIERDLRALMAVVQEGRHDDPTEAMPWAILDGLAQLIRCDSVNFHDSDLPAKLKPAFQEAAEGEHILALDATADDPEFAFHLDCYRQFLPSTYYPRTRDVTSVVSWWDFYTLTELRNTPHYAESFGPAGYKHSIMTSLSEAPDRTRRIVLWRDSGRDFSPRDRLLLELLRPHLYEIYLDSQRRLRRVPQLSPREWGVLQLVHQGHSNSDIARELFISVGTVRKHLEHIYDRTGARTRTAAAALMIPHYSSAQDLR
jgi:DNA-binding CsgD family transcriptional regulator